MAIYLSPYATNVFSTTTQTLNTPASRGHAFDFGVSMSLTTDHDSTDIIPMFPISSAATVRAILFSTDGVATAGAADIGLYTLNRAGDVATAVDVDLFASAQAVTSALTRSDVTNESTNYPLASRFLPLWDTVSGVTSDPSVLYWVCLTITTNVDATNVIGLEAIGVN